MAINWAQHLLLVNGHRSAYLNYYRLHPKASWPHKATFIPAYGLDPSSDAHLYEPDTSISSGKFPARCRNSFPFREQSSLKMKFDFNLAAVVALALPLARCASITFDGRFTRPYYFPQPSR